MIVSFYGTNCDNPEFYAELEERISEADFENLIIGGCLSVVEPGLVTACNCWSYSEVRGTCFSLAVYQLVPFIITWSGCK